MLKDTCLSASVSLFKDIVCIKQMYFGVWGNV